MSDGLPEPRTPRSLSRYARACLEAIAATGEASRAVSVGGAVGLAHFLDYRETHDLDAWWTAEARPDDRRIVIDAVARALRACEGQVEVREWGDMVSVELEQDKRRVFSFQVARRDALLQPPRHLPWPAGLLLDSFEDLLASKMVALVERGAPRDFRDIHAVCEARLADADRCWSLWRKRQSLAGRDASGGRARSAVLLHLERIEQSRPLDRIQGDGERRRAEAVRAWFRGEFLRGIVD